ncbi:hypothetical protein SpCBS45565_g04516 [Spizellomyces sp. 'palustris']|nr:hypothetical protein SpCBS45565_g04516 [Spizellomyces sp. 'palustris']
MVNYSSALLSAAVVGLASAVAALPTDIKTSKNIAVGIPVLLDSNVPLNTTFPGNESELTDYEDDPFPDDLEVEFENPAGLEERDLEKRMTATQYWRQTCVGRHNQARQQVGVPQLQYDTGLEAKACKWGAYLAQYNKFEHGSTGENLYKAWSSQAFDDTKKLKSCQTATDSWWREISCMSSVLIKHGCWHQPVLHGRMFQTTDMVKKSAPATSTPMDIIRNSSGRKANVSAAVHNVLEIVAPMLSCADMTHRKSK